MTSAEEVRHAVLVGGAIAVLAATGGTGLVFVARRLLRTRWSAVANLTTVLVLIGLYAAAAIAGLAIIERQLAPEPSTSSGTSAFVITPFFINPGLLWKLAPALAICLTWAVLAKVASNRTRPN